MIWSAPTGLLTHAVLREYGGLRFSEDTCSLGRRRT
jgi:hypothetical protein